MIRFENWALALNRIVSFLWRNDNKGPPQLEESLCEKEEKTFCLLCSLRLFTERDPIVQRSDTGGDAQGHLRGHCQQHQHPRATRNEHSQTEKMSPQCDTEYSTLSHKPSAEHSGAFLIVSLFYCVIQFLNRETD